MLILNKLRSIFFKVKNANYKNGTFYEENDLLKIEAISSEDLKEMAEDLDENLAQTPKGNYILRFRRIQY